MYWARRRKAQYLGGLILFLGIVGLLVFRSVTNVTPTCFDNKKNGEEVGIDCGGKCLQYCPNELSEPKLRWARSFVISKGVVHSVAYIEHSYPTASAQKVDYIFKLYDADNALITERQGSTYLGPMGRSAIVETLIPTGNIEVANTRFSFIPPVAWEKSDVNFSQVVIKTDRSNIENFDNGTRLTVNLDNKSRYNFTSFDVVAILYDNKDNAITASKIFVPSLSAESVQSVYFTWPSKIDLKNVRNIEVIPRFNPFSSESL